MTDHAPVRTCVGCRRAGPPDLMVRVVLGSESLGLVPDPRRRLPGRGAWLHPDVQCLETAVRRRAFERALRVSGPLDTTALASHVQACVRGCVQA